MKALRLAFSAALAVAAVALLAPATIAAAATPAASTPSPKATPSPSAAPSPSPLPSPSPNPTPPPQITISATSAEANATINVSGTRFTSGQPISILWDNKRLLGSTTSDGNGNFSLDVVIPGDTPGDHQVCVQVQSGSSCAPFQLKAAPSPTPTESASPSASPASPSPAAGPPSPVTTPGMSPVAVLIRPPFVFFPALLLLALAGGFAYWLWSRRGAPPIENVTVVHSAEEAERPYRYERYRPPVVEPAPPAPEEPAPPPAPEVEPPRAQPPDPSPGPSGADVPPDLPTPSE